MCAELLELLLAEENVMDVVGALEHDPELAARQNHRAFLREHVIFKEVCPPQTYCHKSFLPCAQSDGRSAADTHTDALHIPPMTSVLIHETLTAKLTNPSTLNGRLLWVMTAYSSQ